MRETINVSGHSDTTNEQDEAEAPLRDRLTCGCGFGCGCVCHNHMDIPRGIKPTVCERHARKVQS